MRKQILAVMCVAIAGALAVSGSALAQQKTAKACQEEWRANKAANQAAGITEKAYVDKCRAGGAVAAPAAAPAPAPAAKPTASSAPSAAAPVKKPAPAAATTGLAPATGQFSGEALAKAHCPTDTVVWANLSSKIYHFSGHKDYGKTKEGAFMCEKDAVGQGIRAAKNEKHP